MVSEMVWYLESRTEHVPFQNKTMDSAMVAGYTVQSGLAILTLLHEQRLDSEQRSKRSAVLLSQGAEQGVARTGRG